MSYNKVTREGTVSTVSHVLKISSLCLLINFEIMHVAQDVSGGEDGGWTYVTRSYAQRVQKRRFVTMHVDTEGTLQR